MKNEELFAQAEAELYGVNANSVISKYIQRKTKASDRGSKARRSLGNLYALYVLCEDYVSGNMQGSTFTDLMRRMKAMPYGAKLQNHPLDNRLNDEVRRQYGTPDELLPVQPADLGQGRKARKISTALLSESGASPKDTAKFVVEAIDKYIHTIMDNETEYLKEIENANSDAQILRHVEKAFNQNSDARLFEIVSYALLSTKLQNKEVSITLDGSTHTEKLCLYRTGRTNANDGGIDFVLKPLGKFFQVTETLDFKKYFLDFDKINKFPLSFVIKTDLSANKVRDRISSDAGKEMQNDLLATYMDLFEEIITLNELREILDELKGSHDQLGNLKSTIINCFKLEYGHLDK